MSFLKVLCCKVVSFINNLLKVVTIHKYLLKSEKLWLLEECDYSDWRVVTIQIDFKNL